MKLPWKTLLLFLTALWLPLASVGFQKNPRNHHASLHGGSAAQVITEETSAKPGLGQFELSVSANIFLERLTLFQRQLSTAGPGLQWTRVATHFVTNSTHRLIATLSTRWSHSNESAAIVDETEPCLPQATGVSQWAPILEDFEPSAEAMTNTIVLYSTADENSRADRHGTEIRLTVPPGQTDAASKLSPVRVPMPIQATDQRFRFARPVLSRLRRYY